ncbi:hypothetical protein PHYSODRAFT_288494 [Phytophthora sojae]|uniref:RxLR effector protein n=2 Tax=Phytophthora sojae TaxID=67593 RepID=G5A526_PHYSP|nr:hypothetical protein PHYSODRAFT_288494 [Phytophthora sojae]AEK80475.1 Avh14 [Phytophthora sojae]AEK80476.1 Avh14 [Phytophthora sojae]EGZ09775.1 hypothetical protein PHYSODRAFT_288494 [Phytophthora sojae]|eukprot:XP_009534636.1 hypothetical protein PHYSODRAFT_288494 [Phytophthora sojae]
MRTTFILALVIAATLHVSGASLPSANNPNTVVKNDALSAATGLIDAEGERMLRHVEKDEGGTDEERGFSLTDMLKKLKSITDPAKAAKKLAKIKETVKESANRQYWLEYQALKLKHGIK